MRTFAKFATGVAVLVVLFSMQALAQGLVPFTADVSFKGKDGKQMNGKYFIGDKKIRMDMNAQGHQISTISDPDTKTSYMIMHERKMYMEIHAGQNPMQRGPKMPDAKAYDPSNPCASDPDETCKNEGTETVNGRVTDKWVMTSKKNGEVNTSWIDKKLHFPIKTLTSDGAEMELTNVQEGASPASTFEVPAGYQKFDMGAMMGGQRPQ